MPVENVDDLEAAAKEISRDESRRSLALWFGIAGSPLAWAGHLVANYALEEWFACSSSAQDRGEVLGLGVHTASTLINSAMLAIAVASGFVALRCWRKLRGLEGHEGSEGTDRARWMAFAGVVEASLFVGIIVLGYFPALIVGICDTTP